MPTTNLQSANWNDGDENAVGVHNRWPVSYKLSLDDGTSWSSALANPAHLVATLTQFSKTTGYGYLERKDVLNGCQGVEWYDQDYAAGSYSQIRNYEYLYYDTVEHPGNCQENSTIWDHQVVERIVHDRAAATTAGQSFSGVT